MAPSESQATLPQALQFEGGPTFGRGIPAALPLQRSQGDSTKRHSAHRWEGVAAIGGLAAFSGSSLVIYAKEVAWSAACGASRNRDVCYAVSPLLFYWGIAAAILALALAVGYTIGARRITPRGVTRGWGQALLAAEILSFGLGLVALVLVASASGTSVAVAAVVTGFILVGFLVLFFARCGWFVPDDMSAYVWQIIARVHGFVSFAVTAVLLRIALGPPSWVL